MYHAVKFARLPVSKTLSSVVRPLAMRGIVGTYDKTRSYQAGDYAHYNGALYRCLEATTGTWKASKWEQEDTIDSWEDWHLIPNERPAFMPPPVKTNFQSLDGSDTSIDLTSTVGGYVPHDRRTGSWEWHVVNDYGHWATRYSTIMNYLQQKEVVAILEDDPGYFYRGRFSVNQWRSEPERSKIVIDYDVLPHKYEISTSSERWLWDPFSFIDGVIRYTANVHVEGSTMIQFPNSSMTAGTGTTITKLQIIGSSAPCQPEFAFWGYSPASGKTVNDITLTITDTFHNVSRTLTYAEMHAYASLVLSDFVFRQRDRDPIGSSYQDKYGNNTYGLTFSTTNGSVNVNVTYRGGSL